MRRIFLVGCPRSGTTLVQSLLASAPNMVTFTESHFFDKCFSSPANPFAAVRYDGCTARATIDRFCCENDLRERQLSDESWRSADALTAAFIDLLDRNAARQSASGWIEKTPDHLRRIPLIETAAPQASIVHVLRNPAETISSLCKASRDWGKPRSWFVFAVKWGVSVVASARYLGRPGHHLVFYEDVVDNSHGESQRLFEVLGLDWDEGILDRYAHTARAVVAPHESWKRNNIREIGPKADEQIVHNWPQKALLRGLEKLYRKIKSNVDRQE